MYGAGTELYEYYIEFIKSETERTFFPKDSKTYRAYIKGRESNPQRKASSLGKKAQADSKSRSGSRPGKGIRNSVLQRARKEA